MSEVKFINGLRVKRPRETAPDFIKLSGSIKRVELIEWLQNEPDEWINFDVKESRAGNLYIAVDIWKPKKSDNNQGEWKDIDTDADIDTSDDVPF